MPYTHFIRWDEPGLRLRRALCGTLVPKQTHAMVPTCPLCRVALVAWRREQDADEAEEQVDA